MNNSELHKPPRFCEFYVKMCGRSPSAIFHHCTIGCRHESEKCKDCEANQTITNHIVAVSSEYLVQMSAALEAIELQERGGEEDCTNEAD